MKVYTHDEMLDMVVGKKGTPRREELEENVRTFLIGEAIKKARQERNMTQEQLGELMGVHRAQVSRIESGKNLTVSTISRAFRAMGITPKLKLGDSIFAL